MAPVRSTHGEASAGDLYANYKAWCLDNGNKPASNVVLGRRLGERGLQVRQSSGKRIWCGLSLTDSRHENSYASGRNGY